MQESEQVVERSKKWQQLVSKVAEAYYTTDRAPSPAKSVGEVDTAFSSNGKRSSRAKKYNKWVEILRVLRRKPESKLMRKKVYPKSHFAERTSRLTINQNRKPRVRNRFESN